MSALRVIVGLVALAVVSNACLLPPKGCTKYKCSTYADMKIPGGGNWSTTALWVSPYDKLAFVRSSFNKHLGSVGPGTFDNANGPNAWTGLLTKYPGWEYPKLPSLNYEYYQLDSPTVKWAAPTSANANIATCCDACRVTDDCSIYIYDPSSTKYKAGASVVNGTCWFVSSGPSKVDGPFDWDEPSKKGKGKRTKNLGSPKPLNRGEMAALFKNGVFEQNGNKLVFLGGYCNQHTGVKDDPHFVGGHGTRFDFNGELDKAFCLLTDRSLHLNAVLKGYKNDNAEGATVGEDGKAVRSWIRELGLIWTDSQQEQHSLYLVARSGKDASRGAGFLAHASYDGEEVAVPQEAGSSFNAGDLSFAFLGTSKKGWYDLDKFQVVIKGQLDLSFTMRVAHPKLQSPGDAEVHFNLLFNDVAVTEKVHGVLGQTYRNTPSQLLKAVKYSQLTELLGAPVKADGESGAGFLEGSVDDYEASDVLATDCKVSAFAA